MQVFKEELINKIQSMKTDKSPNDTFTEEEIGVLLLASLLEEEQHEHTK